jgi:hypothetical protein
MFTTSKNNVLKETVLATSLDKLITRDPSKFMRSLAQESNISEQLLERLVGFGRACAPVRCAHPSFWAHKHAKRALRAPPSQLRCFLFIPQK